MIQLNIKVIHRPYDYKFSRDDLDPQKVWLSYDGSCQYISQEVGNLPRNCDLIYVNPLEGYIGSYDPMKNQYENNRLNNTGWYNLKAWKYNELRIVPRNPAQSHLEVLCIWLDSVMQRLYLGQDELHFPIPSITFIPHDVYQRRILENARKARPT
jgi:hypothetical protein